MTPLACVEVGGSGCQTVVFDADSWRLLDGAHRPSGADLAIAAPGLIEGGRVLVASNLGWYDVDPAEELGLDGPASVLLNDAEAAALGEAALRSRDGDLTDLVFLGVGTGVGGATVAGGEVVAANLFGHATGFSEVTCRCGRVGCLETVAAGWALPPHLDAPRLVLIARALASAVERERTATARLVVLAGGLARDNPALVHALQAELPDRRVQPSAAPAGAKSTSAWGLRHVVDVAVRRP